MHLIALGVFKHLHTLDLSFHLDRRIGGITRDIDRGTQSVSTLLSIFVFNILPSFFEIILVIGLLWVNYDGFFAGISLLTVVFYVAFTLAITTWRMKYRYDETMSRWEDVATKSFTSMTALNFVQGAIIAVGVTVVLILAAQGVADKNLSLGDMIMIQALLLQLFIPLGSLGIVYRQIKHNFIDMNNMFDLLERRAKVCSPKDAPKLNIIQGKVEFKHISFAYEGKDKVLKKVSFSIESGQKVAIVGQSGSGKSTLAKLLFRFYDVDSGEILIDKQDIKTLNQHSVQSAIGVVPQDTVMFNESIYYNIAYGKQGATQQEVEAAAKSAFMDKFIEALPQGYDTLVGERGLKLSGGEKQRMAIARVLLKNPPILIFDEATSALDSYSEKMVQKAINTLSKKTSTLVIAHRLSTIVDADKIIVLSEGVISESGTHKELLSMNGIYAQLWQIQSKDADEI